MFYNVILAIPNIILIISLIFQVSSIITCIINIIRFEIAVVKYDVQTAIIDLQPRHPYVSYDIKSNLYMVYISVPLTLSSHRKITLLNQQFIIT